MGAAAACIDGAHTTAASPWQPVGEVPPRRGDRLLPRDAAALARIAPRGCLMSKLQRRNLLSVDSNLEQSFVRPRWGVPRKGGEQVVMIL